MPWPLDENRFLVSKATGGVPADEWWEATGTHAFNMELYLMDMNGNEKLISKCPTTRGGHYLKAQPVKARTRPPVFSSTHEGRWECR
jgi:hypothetical protein